MRKRVVLLIYGEGGHHSQMKRLVKLMEKELIGVDLDFISISDDSNEIKNKRLIESFIVPSFRNKFFSLKNAFSFLVKMFRFFKCYFEIKKRYEVVSVISTGPGLSIPFSLLFKFNRVKIIFIETWSRFETKSMAGSVMYKISDQFYVQNKSLLKYYPQATYSGVL